MTGTGIIGTGRTGIEATTNPGRAGSFMASMIAASVLYLGRV